MAISKTKAEPNGDTKRREIGFVVSDVGGEDFVVDVGFGASKVYCINETSRVEHIWNASMPAGSAFASAVDGAKTAVASPNGITVGDRTVTFPAAFAGAGEKLHYVIEG